MSLGPEATEGEVISDHRNPSEVTDDYWLCCWRSPSRFQSSGKWMLFYRTDHLDAAWARAQELYTRDELTLNSASALGGVTAMKVSTAAEYGSPLNARHAPRLRLP
jgi:hypothetical protein